jgi:hypothetical protein
VSQFFVSYFGGLGHAQTNVKLLSHCKEFSSVSHEHAEIILCGMCNTYLGPEEGEQARLVQLTSELPI